VGHRHGGRVDQPVAASPDPEADVIADGDVVDAGIPGHCEEAA
jgi:hypothetical protein